jgi:formylglycine-generating enzyme required for sulfatase activity
VTVSTFVISKYEVTQAQYQSVIGSNPSSFANGADGPSRPVEIVTWYNAAAFCNALSALEGLTACYTINGSTVTADFSRNGYRLPTEAEREFASRGGTGSAGYTYSGSNDVSVAAWYLGNASSTTHPVGTKAANELGLYDMSGNVWEWCWDWYGGYGSSAQTDPTGPGSGTLRVIRGGAWNGGDSYATVAIRESYGPDGTLGSIGFRLVRRPGG